MFEWISHSLINCWIIKSDKESLDDEIWETHIYLYTFINNIIIIIVMSLIRVYLKT